MYNKINLNITGKAVLGMTPEEEQTFLTQIEYKIKTILSAYGFEEIRSNSNITDVVYVDNEWKEGKLI